MQQISSMFSALDAGRRILVLLAVAGTVAGVLAIARSANSPNLSLLYSGLEPAAAGEVVGALEQMGAVYEVRGNAIFVDSTARDSLRMALAAEGKPATGTVGYEILDNLSGFGTTAQMFDAAYWRAKEGELARTILANPQVRAARVHISNPAQRPFSRQTAGSASVMITTGPSGLGAPQARAIKYLVASAVPGVSVNQVTVIDSETGVVQGGDDAIPGAGSMQDGREATLRANVQRLLEARVGKGRAIVEVSVDTVTEREEIVERTFDPDSRVAISTITEETTSNAQDRRNGSVTVSGNLPDGDAGGAGANSTSAENGTREQVNYEVSETQREILRAPGAVRRISVAVLVDGLRAPGPDGETTWTPRPEEELAALKSLVESAVGFDAARGDVITLRSLEFPPLEVAGTEATAPSVIERLGIDAMRLVQVAVLALVTLILGLFVVRPVLLGAGRGGRQVPRLDPPSQFETPRAGRAETENAQPPALSGSIDDGAPGTMAVVSEPAAPIALPAQRESRDPSERLRRLADDNGSEAAAVLRRWMEDGRASA